MDVEARDADPPDSLLALGWHQGAVFLLPGAACGWNEVPEEGEQCGSKMGQRRVKASELLVLISQDCDILSKEEQRVEALLVRIKDKPNDQRYLARIANNSAREFVLDSERGYVADARVRILIAKEVLYDATPEPWTMDERTHEEFIDWLAARYDRPAVETEVFEAVCRPIRNMIERLKSVEPEVFDALNRSVRSIRVRESPRNSPTLEVGLLVILEDDIEEEESAAVAANLSEIERVVTEGMVPCNLQIGLIPYGEVLLSEFDRTRPLDLDYMTDRGENVPLGPVKVFADQTDK